MAVTWKQIAYLDEVATLSTNTPAAVDASVGAAGSGVAASKDDHAHQVSVASPVALTNEAADGTSDSLARADHKHAFGAFAADVNFNGYEGTDLCLHNSASDPTTPVLGKIYFKTGDLHPYVCTVIA